MSTSAAAVNSSIDLVSIEKYGILRASPSWKDVETARANLKHLAETTSPYDQMETDKDAVIRYAATLERSLDVVTYALCLAADLARFTTLSDPAQRLDRGLRALSEGLDLPSLDENATRVELSRCMRDLDPQLQSEVAQTISAAADKATAFRETLESSLEKVRAKKPPPEGASFTVWSKWQDRLSAAALGQTEIPPDLDYLRCLAEGSLAGTILKGRLRNATPRAWSLAFHTSMLSQPPIDGYGFFPPWFAYGILAALGFGAGSDPQSAPAPEADRPAISEFLAKVANAPAKKGLIVIRSIADSLTDNWRDSAGIPTLLLTAAEYAQCDRFDLRRYFEPRLNGILVEMGPGEQLDQVLRRTDSAIESKLPPNARRGLLLSAPLSIGNVMPDKYKSVAVAPRDPNDACNQAFPPFSPTITGTANP